MEKRVSIIALDSKVLVVAVEGTVLDWAAYIGAVQGEDHDSEWQQVRDHGSKLTKEIAEFLFPEFAKEFAYRY